MFFCTSKRLILLVILGLALVFGLAFLFQWQSVLGYAPFLFILLCPLMHLLGGHSTSHRGDAPRDHHDDRTLPTKDGKKPSCH